MEEVPKDAEPISEEQFERLPEYVHQLMASSLAGELEKTSKSELAEIHARYFMARVEEVGEDQSMAGKRSLESVSNSPPSVDGKMDEEDA